MNRSVIILSPPPPRFYKCAYKQNTRNELARLVMGTIFLVIIIIYLFKRYSTCSRLQRILYKLLVRGSVAFMRNVAHEAHEV